MGISPKIREDIQSHLSLCMPPKDVSRFSNLNGAITAIKQDESCWQAPYSVAIHAFCLNQDDATLDDKSLLQDLIGYSMEPLEALLQCIGIPQDPEQSRVLFHTKLALGMLSIADGDVKRSQSLMHQVASTKLNNLFIHDTLMSYGGNLPNAEADTTQGKLLAAFAMLPILANKDWLELLYLMIEAASCQPGITPLQEMVSLLIDRWAAQCEEVDNSLEYESPDVDWIGVFTAAADVLALCEEIDSSASLPSDCEEASAQFLAWKLGQIVAKSCLHHRWSSDPFRVFKEFLDSPWVDWDYPDKHENFRRSLILALGLFSESKGTPHWPEAREIYVSMWKNSYAGTCHGLHPCEIGPDSDIYWAMRIGFADKMIEEKPSQSLITTKYELETPITDTADMRLQLMKSQQDSIRAILDRLPPTNREIRQGLEHQLRNTWKKLPSKVFSKLVKAEKFFRTEVDDDEAVVCYAKTVEAVFFEYFVQPLKSYLQERNRHGISLCFPPPRGREHKKLTTLSSSRPSLSEWGVILKMLLESKVLTDLGTKELRDFLREHFGMERLPDLRPLCDSIQKVQGYRGGSAHYREAESRYENELDELKEMRKLVLGIGQPSVIALIVQDFPKRSEEANR
ncbi:MAG: hypothetical protein WC749_06425 [Dehalococcoidia bacterium]